MRLKQSLYTSNFLHIAFASKTDSHDLQQDLPCYGPATGDQRCGEVQFELYEVAQVQNQHEENSEILISGDIQLLAKGLRRDCLEGRDPRLLLQPSLQVICVKLVKCIH